MHKAVFLLTQIPYLFYLDCLPEIQSSAWARGGGGGDRKLASLCDFIPSCHPHHNYERRIHSSSHLSLIFRNSDEDKSDIGKI